MEENLCPICNKFVRSDAMINIYCILCGMGIPVSYSIAKISSRSEKILYFCRRKCLSIYEAEIA
ncbi:MAG TPA: hypothetical protein ENI29_05820 [bacterium]|nr:hypothetical protein [bacterium]